jgi:formate dehydrogenase maturation protein FdhE
MKKYFPFVIILYAALALSGCNNVLTNEDVKEKVDYCQNRGFVPWYTFVKQGHKESGILYVNCRSNDEEKKDKKYKTYEAMPDVIIKKG